MIDKEHKGVLVILTDSAAQETKIKALANGKTDYVTQACTDLLSPEALHIITFDKGNAFAQYVVILCHALSFMGAKCEREHKQFDRSKSMPLDNLSDKLVQAIEDNLNHRPRKVLGYQTPLEVNLDSGKLHFILESAAKKIENKW